MEIRLDARDGDLRRQVSCPQGLRPASLVSECRASRNSSISVRRIVGSSLTTSAMSRLKTHPLRSSRRCPAPNISSVTLDHDDSCELPPREGGGSPNQCCGHSRTRTRADSGIPARTPRLRLPRQPTTAELCVVNLIAQHDPEPNAQLPRRRDAGLREPFLPDLPPIEALETGIGAHCI